jgi:hypothetical protein
VGQYGRRAAGPRVHQQPREKEGALAQRAHTRIRTRRAGGDRERAARPRVWVIGS